MTYETKDKYHDKLNSSVSSNRNALPKNDAKKALLGNHIKHQHIITEGSWVVTVRYRVTCHSD